MERSFHTAQDRLVKQLRLAKVSSLAEANAFLEKEYWPEWNEYFARPVQDFPNHHRPVTEAQDLAAILSHVEDRVIANDFTFSFAAQRYLIPRDQAQAAMRRQPLRVELRLNGGLQARYQGRYLNIVAWPRAHRGPCVARVGRSSTGPQRSQRRRQKRLDAGLLRPAHAPLWKLIQD